MKTNNITVYQMVSQIIKENQLTWEEEDGIRKLIEEKEKKKREEDGETCLAAVVEQEMENGIKMGKVAEAFKRIYKPVLNECFWENEIGKLPVSCLSAPIIRKFIIQAEETYKMNRNSMICFMGLLQVGLDKISKDGMAELAYDKYLYLNYVGEEKGIRYIDNPYTEEETARIKEWIEIHPYDTRGLALGLWFSGNLSAGQIVNLKRKDCHKGLLEKWEKGRLTEKALKLQPEDGEYVFMVEKRGRWEKLTAKGLQIKLYCICEGLGIGYKKIQKDEAINCKE